MSLERTLERVARLVFLVAPIACGSDLPFEPAGPDHAPDPSVMGPFEVGVKTITFVDPSRITPGRTLPRNITAEIWYPATANTGTGRGEFYWAIDFIHDSRKHEFDRDELGGIDTTAEREATPLSSAGPYPIVFFSHGNGAMRVQSTYLTVFLASHGYVVVSPDHEGNTLSDFAVLSGFDFTDVLESYVERPLDLIFMLQELEDLDEDFVQVIDFERVGAAGHSLGATTALRVAGLSDRFDVVVPQSPPGYLLTWRETNVELEDLIIPIMIQAGGLDDTLPPEMNARSLWDHITPPGFYLDLKTAGHFTYTDLCVMNNEAVQKAEEYGIGDVLSDGCGPENLDPNAAFPVIRQYTIGLFNRYLRDSPGSEVFLTEAAGQARLEGELTLELSPPAAR